MNFVHDVNNAITNLLVIYIYIYAGLGINNVMLGDLHIVSIIKASCTEMAILLLINTFKVRSLHIMMSMLILNLTGKNHPTVKINE